MKLDPELLGAIQDLIAASDYHKEATENFLSRNDQRAARWVESTQMGVADAGNKVARIAKSLGIKATVV